LFDERCRSLRAASVASLLERMTAAGVGSAAPRSCGASIRSRRAFGRSRRRGIRGLRRRAGSARSGRRRPKVLRAADAQEELERIAEWCRRRVLVNPTRACSSCLPWCARSARKLATLIRQALDPRSVLQRDGALPIRGWGSKASTARAAADDRARAHDLELVAGAEGDFRIYSRWLRAPHWSGPSAAARTRLGSESCASALTQPAPAGAPGRAAACAAGPAGRGTRFTAQLARRRRRAR